MFNSWRSGITLLFVVIAQLSIGQRKVAIEDFTTRNTFAIKTISGINWMANGKYYTALDGNSIKRYDIRSGKAEAVIIDATVLPESVKIDEYAFSQGEKKVLLTTGKKSIYRRSYTAEYYVFDLEQKSLKKLSENGKQSYATFSPDGKKVAFVRDNNLYYTILEEGREVQVTSDGKFNHIINGTTDWVYEEEFGFVNAFYWSPDGNKLAYHRFDESGVKDYNMQVWGKTLYPTDYKFKYPKAGEQNSEVEIWIFDLSTGKKVKCDLGTEKDIYVPRVAWTNNSNALAIRKLNRLQNESKLIHVNAIDGSSVTILEERSQAYVDVESVDELIYLSDGKHFIATSESTGYKQAFLYSMSGRPVRQITTGNYDVIALTGYDETKKLLYYTSSEASPLERHLYSVSLDGKKKYRLTTQAGQHSINMSPDFQYYIDHFSSGDRPTVATLYLTSGNKPVKILEENKDLQSAVAEYEIAVKEFFSYPTVDGTMLNGYYLKPKDFVQGKRYPILLYQYSGPNSQNAGNSWAGNHFYFHQYLVQNGYIVAVVDPRGTAARGEAFRKSTYRQLGKLELEDIVAAAKFFKAQPFIDADRVGVWGWSYGGYMTALAMTKGDGGFKAGIAVSPVTNWRFYDTVYTERFLQTPQLNPGGYDDNSPLTHAVNLKGHFLLVHGTGDDNVHFQNSVMFEEALIQAGKQFRSFFYPDKNHGIQGGATRLHLYTMMADFILEKL